MSVKVGVRVRPFNPRQVALNCRLCVDMIGNMTRLFDADDPENKHRDFTFDYSFWSHDQFTAEESGYLRADTDKYADQQKVFEAVGLQILQNAWDGYHCCLFAYGQTGSGKSYSMVGYGANKGIVPISCEEIFNRIAKNDNPHKDYEVHVSMMEIYNEKVQDLLIPMTKRPKEGHKIREHPTLGIYVEGMSKHFVDTYPAIEKIMEEGARNRSIAATQMNASSSRAHTIISIQFKQTEVVSNKKREKLSVIHLVDLAGSEKVGKTGATGDRLKEAAGINKSLSVLGLVISTLADKAMGKGKGKQIIVPYRDSCLTRILQNALGGNSKTLMICAISPATDNYEETLSTLRYADQAKKIQNKAVINESQTDKLIRTLTEERQTLREKLAKMEQMFKQFSLSPEEIQQKMEAQAQLKFISDKEQEFQMSKKDRKKAQEEIQTFTKFDLTKPHIANMNQDPQLSRKVNYAIEQAETKIGKRGAEVKNDIEIGGMGIRQLHAIIKNNEDAFFLNPIFNGEESGCYLNGDMISKEEQIYHLDRISFGTNNMFLVLIPETPPRDDIDEKNIDWDFAQNQLYLKKEQLQQKANEEKEKKIKEQTQAMLKQKVHELQELQKSLKESEQLRKKVQQQKESEKAELQKKIRDQQNMILQKQKQIQTKKRVIKDSETQQKQKTKEKYFFERKLLKTLPKCIQLNLIAKQFKKNVSMSVKMMLADDDYDEEDLEMKKRTIAIKVVNREVGYSYWWDVETLSNRYYIIKDMSEQYFETGTIPILDQNNDPFWDPQVSTLIGRGFLTTKALAYMFDNPATLPIIGEDQHCGELTVNLIPTDETGTRNLCQQMDEQEIEFQPEELLEKPLHYLIQVKQAKIPINYKDIYVEYAVKVNEEDKEIFKTNVVQEQTNAPHFNYSNVHKLDVVTQKLLDYLTNAKIVFKVYGCEIIPEEKKTESPKTKGSIVDPDVQKAKREDLKKKQAIFNVDNDHYSNKVEPPRKPQVNKKSPAIVDPKRPDQTKRQQTYKYGGSTTNNRIHDRNQKNTKDKDCIIY